MIISITQEDIESGNVNDSFSCPIALAIKRICNPFFICVGWETVYIKWNLLQNKSKAYPLPIEASDFVRKLFDSKPVEPFSFDMDFK